MQLENYLVVDRNGNKYFVHKINLNESKRLADFFSKLSPSTIDLFHPHPFDAVFLRRILKNNKDSRVALIGLRNAIVGYAFLSRISLNPGLGYVGVVISEKYQGTGLGRPFLSTLFKIGKENGFNKVILNVYKQNLRAVRLYSKLGFKRTKINFYLKYVVVINEIIKNEGFSSLVSKVLDGFKKTTKEKSKSIWMMADI